MNAVFVDAGVIAKMLGLSDRDAFLRRHDRLQLENGFPLPMPHSRRPLLWRRSQIAAWIDEHGLPANADLPEVARGTNVVLMKEAAQA